MIHYDSFPETAAEGVRRGVELLDEKRPGWATEYDEFAPEAGQYKINVACLDLESATWCVLGQLYETADPFDSGYSFGLRKLSDEGTIIHGGTYGFDQSPASADEFADLTEAWADVIIQRRQAV